MASGNADNNLGGKRYWNWGADNTEISVTLPAPGADKAWEIIEILYGFDADPSAGKEISVAFGGTTEEKWAVVRGGAEKYTPSQMLRAAENEAIVVTLAAGGAGIQGYLNVLAQQVPV